MNASDLHDDSEDVEFTPAERARAANKSTWVSVVVNIVLSTTQITVGIFAKSQALIADGVHSLSDLISDFVVLFASHHSQKDADEDHPYGHQRFETAASMVLGGLRCCEVIGLRLEDLQPTNKRVFIADGKGGHQRLIPMSAQFFQSISLFFFVAVVNQFDQWCSSIK